jgi:hypothetical protein
MRTLRLALLLLLLLPGTAWAGGVSVRTGSPPREFTMVGLQWQGPGSVSFRTRSVAGTWSAWHAAAPEAEDLPDRASAERRARSGWRIGNPWWTGRANAIQYRRHGRVLRIRPTFVWSQTQAVPPARTTYATGAPLVIPRLSWGADEKIRRAAPRYAGALRFAVVHHTAGTNSYTREQSAAIVRGIMTYHVKSNGWNDIGYNFLVDKYGQVFEGRYGGVERNVIGAHAEGFNTGSVGVAVIGNYGSAEITPAARDALVKLLAWRLDVAHVDPTTSSTLASGGNGRYPAGSAVFLRTVSGHRDTGFTSCPGDRLYGELAAITGLVSQLGLPKIYAPAASGKIGSRIRFTARLSSGAPWTVTVRDAAGAVVASGGGAGQTVDWTWDATLAKGSGYSWSIDAAGARSAKGAVGAVAQPSAPAPAPTPTPAPPLVPLLGPVVIEPPTVTPNGDGLNDTATVTYTLGLDAVVTATLLDAAGAVRATLLQERKPLGKRSFTLTADAVADGTYRVVVAAVADDGSSVASEAPLTVSRLLRDYAVEPELFSPNGDGRSDTVEFGFELAGPAQVSIKVYKGAAWVATAFAGPLPPGPQSIPWDGRKRYGRLLSGEYRAEIVVTDALSSVAQSVTLRADSTLPKLTLVSLAPLRLKLSEPADVTVDVNGKRFVTSEEAGVFTVGFAGRALKVRAVAVDEGGNVSKPLLAGFRR